MRLVRVLACLLLAGVWSCDDEQSVGVPADTSPGDEGARDAVPIDDRGPRDVDPADADLDARPRDAAVDATADAATDATTDAGRDMSVDMTVDAAPVACETDDDCLPDDACLLYTCNADAGLCEATLADGCCIDDSQCDPGTYCAVARAACVPIPAPGTLVITELMVDPSVVDDASGEWIEILNRGLEPVLLNRLILEGTAPERHVIEAATPIEVPAGGYALLVRNGDPLVNGGLDGLYAYGGGIPLSNGGDRIALLTHTGNLLDEVSYGPGWPLVPGASLSLRGDQQTPVANDDPAAWCAGSERPGVGRDLSSPGVANPECPEADTTIDWCRLQSPRQVEATAGDDLTVYGRVFEAGISDATDGVDAHPDLIGQVGFGPDGSDPSMNPGAWDWFAADPNAGWSAQAAGEPGNDEYTATVRVPAAGRYDFAYRFSRDRGFSWTYCDGAAGAGQDGAENGYQPENAGDLTSFPGVEGEAPAPGDVVITEILYDPQGVLAEETAEWIEVQNVSARDLSLDGCRIGDPGSSLALDDLSLRPGQIALFARSADPAVNGGLAVTRAFGFSLNNGGDTITLACADGPIDVVVYGMGFPPARATSISLDAGLTDAASNDAGASWCVGEAAYFGAGTADEHRGTPGAQNPVCPEPDVTVDWCRLQFPLDVDAPAGGALTVYVRVFEAGLTDRTPQNDRLAGFVGQVGIGAPGSQPDDLWAWTDAVPNAGWDANLGGEPNNDEWQAEVAVPDPGIYAFAGRFSRDGGASWTLCDRNAGAGQDGAENGYQPENAGVLTSLPSPCQGVVCDAPGAASCEGDVRVVPRLPGLCEVMGDQGACRYEADHEDCALRGATCEAGACVGGAAPPQPGDLVITEIMYDTSPPLAEERAEWFEVHNPTADALDLTGCAVADSATSVVLGPLVVASDARLIFARSNDPALNGGLPRVDAVFGFGLNNAGDTVAIRCGGQVIDQVAYNASFPAAATIAMSLDPAGDAASNDGAGAWCRASDIYFAGAGPAEAHRGTPGAPNPACPVVNACEPNPCNAPPAAECADGDTRRTYQGPGACVAEGPVARCTYAFVDADCPAGQLCTNGVCAPPGLAGPAAGEVIFTEVMADPHFDLADATAEWLELTNVSNEVRTLEGCVVSDVGAATNLGAIVLPPGQAVVLAINVNPAVNGGLQSPQALGFGLSNGGERVALSCGGVVIDDLTFDDVAPWPTGAQAYSIGLDPTRYTAAANDQGGNWCLARAVYYDDPDGPAGDNYGSPGGANPPCDEPANFGRLQFPLQIQGVPGEQVVVYGRVFHPGITDRSTGNDPSPRLRGQLGVGPEGVNPAVEPDRFTWQNSGLTPAFDAAAAGEPGNDEYLSTLTLPEVGRYDYAWRFSADGGRTWIYADGGAAGSSDGYQLENAGDLQVAVGDVCTPNPCNTPPAPDCADADTRNAYPAVGQCVVQNDLPACTYPAAPVDCAPGEVCQGGVCALPGQQGPAAGEVIFTEIMFDPHFDLADATAEWVELTNVSAGVRTLNTCVISDAGANTNLGAITLQPGASVVLATSADPAVNGGLVVPQALGFGLGNSGERIALTCNAVLIDDVTYDDVAPWPTGAQAHTLSLDPAQATAAGNNAGTAWCLGRGVYYDDPDGFAGDNFGSPGAANPACDVLAQFGRLQFPLQIQGVANEEVIVYGRVFHAGITDRSPVGDRSALLRAQLGLGPDGVDPAADPARFTWIAATLNAGYDGNAVGEPNNDEYQATLRLPVPGRYDYAWRFSADGGRTWRYADGQPAGSSDGYQLENAGDLLVGGMVDPCNPNPCNTPPAADCADGDTRNTYPAIGQCAAVNGQAACSYPAVPEECAPGTCMAGACVGGAPGPAVGEVVITELLYDPHGDIIDNNAEWIEIRNVAAGDRTLTGCRLANPQAGINVPVLVLPAGGHALFARSADPLLNGGLPPPVATFGFALGNSGGTVTLSCGGTVIDTVVYDDVAPWPAGVQYRAISLDVGSQNAQSNDNGANWCAAREVFYFDPDGAAGHNYGTPNTDNPPCAQAAQFGRLQFPLQAQGAPAEAVVFFGRVYHPGITDRSARTDPNRLLRGQLGYGPDGSDPSMNPGTWTWMDAVGNQGYDGAAVGEPDNDEYLAQINLPAPGRYDFAWRFSADGGFTWRYADGQAAGSSDGYQPANAGDLVVLDVPALLSREGQVLISEIHYAPEAGLEDFTAEWVELYNTSDFPVQLQGCTLEDETRQRSPLDGVVLPARGYVVIAKSADPARNGGLQPAATFTFTLDDGGDTVALSCRFEIDRVTYDDGVQFPMGRAAAIQIDPTRLDVRQNDFGGLWCLGQNPYFQGGQGANLGTPGAANRDCGPLQPFDEAGVQRLFNVHCAGCHVAGQTIGGLNLDDFAAQTIGVPSVHIPAMPLITRGDHTRSYMWYKLSGQHFGLPGGQGVWMPPAQVLPESTVERFRLYIQGL